MTLTIESKKISYVQISPLSPDGGQISFIMDGKECKASLEDVLPEAEALLNKLPDLRSLEQKQISDLEEAKVKALQEKEEEKRKAEEARIALKKAQDHLAELLTGDPDKKMTDEMALIYPELQDGISIDAGDYYREAGKTILYRAKRDMLPYEAATMSPTGANAALYWTGHGISTNPAPSSKYKYPKGTEKEYMGALYYAREDTNLEPDAGYPIWDLAENKPIN